MRYVWRRRKPPCIADPCNKHASVEAKIQRVYRTNELQREDERSLRDDTKEADLRKYPDRFVTRTFSKGKFTVAEPQTYTTQELHNGTALCEYDWDEQPGMFDWVNKVDQPQARGQERHGQERIGEENKFGSSQQKQHCLKESRGLLLMVESSAGAVLCCTCRSPVSN
jgi:hypothetical protein